MSLEHYKYKILHIPSRIMLLSRSELTRSELIVMDSKDKELQRLGMLVQTQLKNTEEGKTIFEYGLRNKWKWRPMCYKNQNFRAYFTMQMYCVRADVISKAVTTVVEERLIKQNFFKNLDSVVSFGCGPGSELYGFREYLQKTFPYSSRRRNDPRFIGYDTELGWMHYIEEMGFQFYELRNTKICRRLLQDMAAVDVILIPFSLRQTEQLDDTQGLDILGVVTKKAKVVMVLDVDGCLPSNALVAKGFRHFMVTDLLGTQVVVYCFVQSEFQPSSLIG